MIFIVQYATYSIGEKSSPNAHRCLLYFKIARLAYTKMSNLRAEKSVVALERLFAAYGYAGST